MFKNCSALYRNITTNLAEVTITPNAVKSCITGLFNVCNYNKRDQLKKNLRLYATFSISNV